MGELGSKTRFRAFYDRDTNFIAICLEGMLPLGLRIALCIKNGGGTGFLVT